MKLFFTQSICFLVSLSLFSQIQGNDAIALSSCTGLTVIEVPEYDKCYGYDGYGFSCGERQCCNMLFMPTYYLATPLYQLQEHDQTGVWVNIGDRQISRFFNNLPKGEYRVEVTLPQILESCAVQLEEYPYTEFHPWEIWYSGNFIGYLKTYDGVLPHQPPIIYHTNSVLVGPTDSDDIDMFFIKNGAPNYSPFVAYDEGIDVMVDVAGSANYNMWYFAITEYLDGNSTRWWGNGWQDGLMPPVIEVSNSWPFGDPLAHHTYRVQLVIENRQCRNGIEWPNTSWNVWEGFFFVCPTGTNCRFVFDREIGELTLYPNPTSSFVTLDNYKPSLHGTLELKVFEMTGRLRINTQINDSTIDLSQLEPGTYIVKVLYNNIELHSSQLIVQ